MKLNKKFLSLALAAVMTVSTCYWAAPLEAGAAAVAQSIVEEHAGVSLSDGTYAVTGKMVKVDKRSVSMADAAFVRTCKVKVENGKYYITLNFKGMSISSMFGYLSKLEYYKTGYTLDNYGNPVGSLASVTIDSYQTYSDGTRISDNLGKNYPDIVTFEVIPEALEDGYVPLRVFVPVMESISKGSGTQNVFLKLDWNTVKATSSNDTAFNDAVAPHRKNQTIVSGGVTYKVTTAGSSPKVQYVKTTSTRTSITIPSKVKLKGISCTVTSIAANAFKNNKRITAVTIPTTVTAIGTSAFQNCTKLKSVTISRNVTTIGKNAFRGAKALKTVTVKSAKIKTVGQGAFTSIYTKAVIKTAGLNTSQKKLLSTKIKKSGIAKTVKIK